MNDTTRNRAWKWSVMTLFGLAALMLPAGGYCLYRHATQTIRSEKQSELSAFAELKTGQIVEWRKHRLADARANSTGLIRTYVDQWIKGSVEASLEAGILARLRTLRDLEELQNMLLVAQAAACCFRSIPAWRILIRMRSSWSHRRWPRMKLCLATSFAALPATRCTWTWQPPSLTHITGRWPC